MTVAGEALLRRLALTNGQANADGGALRISTENSTVRMETCSLQGNTSTNRGGAVFVDDGKLVMIDCSVNGNQSTGNGGGISAINNAVSGSDADANGSGHANLLKYFHRIPPLGVVTPADRAALPAVSCEEVSGNKKVTLTYRRRFGVTGIIAAYFSSNDLVNWSPQSPNTESVIGSDPVTGDPIIRAEFILPANIPRIFYQLRITLPP